MKMWDLARFAKIGGKMSKKKPALYGNTKQALMKR